MQCGDTDMATYSDAFNLVWNAAANEAAQADFEFIEPFHLLIGICVLEKAYGRVGRWRGPGFE